MSRRVSYGGGESSLGYLFGSEDKNKSTTTPPKPPPAKPVVYAPPYGIDAGEGEEERAKPPLRNPSSRFHDQRASTNSSTTVRPSTKVKSVPGGDSSLGYLFGEKS